MSSKLFSLLTITIAFLFLSQSADGAEQFGPKDFFNTCGNTFSCGNKTGITYPFRGILDPAYCGHPGFTLECHHNTTMIEIMDFRYNVLEIDENNQTLTLIRPDILERACPGEITNTTLDTSLFDYTASCTNYTFFYGCPESSQPGISVPSCGDGVYMVGGNWGPGNCETSVIVPVLHNGDTNQGAIDGPEFSQVLHRGFEITWKINSTICRACEESGGRCGFNYEVNQQACFCPDRPFVSATSCRKVSSPVLGIR